MSISDVLFDAEEAIKRYLAKDMITGFVGFSEGTPELKAKVVDFLSTMRKMPFPASSKPVGRNPLVGTPP